MELLEDPAFKSKYQKHKLRVKLWESDFMEKHARRPNKNDIKKADISIRESYKMYWKLKTRALEETLMDITFSDDISNTTAQNTIEAKNEGIKSLTSISGESVGVTEEKENKVDGTERRIKDSENIDPHNSCEPQRDSRNSVAKTSADSENVDGVWGEHLSKSKEPSPKKRFGLSGGRSSSFQLSQNKFSNFAKRNPRKSLSTSKLRSKSEKSIDVGLNKPERSDGTDTSIRDGFEPPEMQTGMFSDVDGLKVTYAEAKPVTQSINAVQQLMEGHKSVNRNLNQGWLDRCTKHSNLEYPALNCQRLSAMSDSGIESMESSIHSPVYATPVSGPAKSGEISDDEDFICNSDAEEEHRNKRVRNYKKSSEQEIRPAKRSCVVENNTSIPSIPLSDDGPLIDSKSESWNDMKANAKKDGVSISVPDITANVDSDETQKLPVEKRIGPTTCDSETKAINNVPRDDANSCGSKVTEDKPVGSRRKIVRRTKRASSKDSDYTEDEKSVTNRKTRKSTSRSQTTRKNNKSIDDCPGGKRTSKTNVARTRSSRTKRLVEKEADKDDMVAENAEDKGEAIYGVETLQAIPRFTVRATNSSNLVEQFSKTIGAINDHSNQLVAKESKRNLTDKEKLEKKIADGKVNENFVRINLKKKVFVRGKKNFNFSKYKKNQWKQRKKELGSGAGSLDVADLVEKNGSVLSCFKCGDVGHFSRNCPKAKSDYLMPLEEYNDDSEFPTLEEAQQMATQNAAAVHANRIDRLPERPSYDVTLNQNDGAAEEKSLSGTEETKDELWEPIEDEEMFFTHKIPEDLVSKLLPPDVDSMNSLYNLKEDQSLIETPPEVFETLHMFGHEKFRSGQEKAVMRILSGLSTLVTLSTGSGKSLCYQLPAYLYSKRSKCISLVISPLVSLMDDQVTGVPSFLSAACLHTNQTPKVRENIMEMVKGGKVNVLLVSPEAVVAGEKSTGFGALLRQLPPIAFACIDEAHCISQWSHNFRPSYLMVCRVLKEKLKVKTVLALTATATKSTAESIVRHLNIPDGNAGIISDIPVPRNLVLTMSKDINRDHSLISLIRSERFEACDSIIVYCTRREECSRIAAVLRTSLQDLQNPESTSVKVSSIAEAYHAGLSAHRRKVVQKAFMNGQTRIVVATIAFGMGLNKSDIRAVIHYNMPSTFESYVQEIGRAGRDGLEAQCHVFLSPTEDHDKWELKRHIYANGVDRYTIRRLLQKVFVPCSCEKLCGAESKRRCAGHEVAIPIDETVSALDVSEETISTLLCYLELHPKKFITVLSSVYVRAKVSSYNGPQALKQAALTSPPLAMAIALDLQKGISHESSSTIEFPVVDVASAIGWDSGVVKSHLKSLEWKTMNGVKKRSAISVRYDTLGLRVRAPGDLTETELDEALDALVSRTQSRESSALQQLEAIDIALQKFAVPTVLQSSVIDDSLTQKSESLKGIIRSYFTSEENLFGDDIPRQKKTVDEAQIANDVRTLVLSYRDSTFTGRTVARIFYGIQSPNYPAYIWSKCRFWRAHLSCDFATLCQIATREILALR